MTVINVTRRDVIRLGAGTLLSIGLWPGRLSASDSPPTGDFTFFSINDLHYREAACTPWFEKVIAQMKKSAPDAEFCLLGGDIADNGTHEQLMAIRRLFENLGIPSYSVIGNHDFRTQTDHASY